MFKYKETTKDSWTCALVAEKKEATTTSKTKTSGKGNYGGLLAVESDANGRALLRGGADLSASPSVITKAAQSDPRLDQSEAAVSFPVRSQPHVHSPRFLWIV